MIELPDTEAAEIASLLQELLTYAPSWAVDKWGLGAETNDAIDLLKSSDPAECEFGFLENLFRLNTNNFTTAEHAEAWALLLIDQVLESVDEDEIATNTVKRLAMVGAFSSGVVDVFDEKTWSDKNLWTVSEEKVDGWLNDPDRNSNRDWAYQTVENILGIENAVREV